MPYSEPSRLFLLLLASLSTSNLVRTGILKLPGSVLQGADWNGQVKLGNGQFVGVNYLQSVTPNLALGGEAFWLGQQRKSGAGFAARYADKENVATAQVATTGLVSVAYLRRISEKVESQSCWSSLHR